jgi:hypothetical protein
VEPALARDCLGIAADLAFPKDIVWRWFGGRSGEVEGSLKGGRILRMGERSSEVRSSMCVCVCMCGPTVLPEPELPVRLKGRTVEPLGPPHDLLRERSDARQRAGLHDERREDCVLVHHDGAAPGKPPDDLGSVVLSGRVCNRLEKMPVRKPQNPRLKPNRGMTCMPAAAAWGTWISSLALLRVGLEIREQGV